MAINETKTDSIRGVPDVRGWINRRHSADNTWGNIARQNVARIKSGKMGTDALRLWIRLNGPRVNPHDYFIDTITELCPAAIGSMSQIIENRFQEHPANTTAALILEEGENGTIVINVTKITREKTMGEDGRFHLAEKKSTLASSHPCAEISRQLSRRERFASAIQHVVWSR